MKNIKYFTILLVVLMGFANARPSSNDGKMRLIKTSESGPAVWLDQHEINSLIQGKVNFMDITNRIFPVKKNASNAKELPSTLRYEAVVNNIFTKLSISRMSTFLTEYSNSFVNRYYESQNGLAASEWMLSEVNGSISMSKYAGNVSVRTFSHDWVQNSVIARIEGSDPELKGEIVILGAHLDSVSSEGNAETSAAPGADDNASGSVVLLETLRALLESEFTPKRTIEFQWYSAEEGGLKGSADIAEAYYNEGVNVISMLNFDVVGYHTEGRDEISIIKDYTDSVLSEFLRVLVDGYLTYTWTDNYCGYACSDHASWYEYGFAAGRAREIVSNPYMHTSGDTLDRVDINQVLEFTKLAVGYAIEISEPL